jgi:hypothetical protein
MGALVIENPPAVEPIVLAQAKNYLKVPLNVSNDDLLIAGFVQAAREEVERITGRSLINKGYRQSLDSFPYFTDSVMSQMAYPPSYYSMPRYSTTLWNYSQMMKLQRSPLQAIKSLTYTDPNSGLIDSIYPALFAWLALTEYTLGESIEDANGNQQTVSTVQNPNEDGTYVSGATTPSWNTTPGGTTTDGTQLVWTCIGPAPTGSFIYDADSTPPRIFPLPGSFWPPCLYVPNAVQVHFIAGYGAIPWGLGTPTGNSCEIPMGLIKLLLQLLAHWYRNREPVVAGSAGIVPYHLESQLWHWRVLDFAQTRG